MTVLPPRPALDEIDQDLTAACIARHNAWRNLCIKDCTDNRHAYTDACDEVDALLDMRNEMIVAERIVSA